MNSRYCYRCHDIYIKGAVGIVKCDCGSERIRGETFWHRVCTYGRIPINPKRRTGAVYSADSKFVYITCPKCCRVNTIETDEVESNGFANPGNPGGCINCRCGIHYWPYLDGWAKRRASHG